MNAILQTVLFTMATAATPPTMVRIAIVDNSPSMHGERIDAVRSELTNVVRQLPPSPEYPVVLIVFHGQVEPAVLLTDPKAAEDAVVTLRGNGLGTHIAPALVKARDELLRYQTTSNILVMLYTDGEDDDQAGIRQAESDLDVLFGQRSQQGLSQSVFVKRWGNANAALVASLRAHGHIQVLDAGELSVEPLTVTPTVEMIDVRRDPHDPQCLMITYLPSVTWKGTKPSGTLPTASFVCQNTCVLGQKQAAVELNAKPVPSTITVPVPADAEKAKRLTLVFRVTPVTNPTSANTFVLPILSASTLSIPVKLPALAVRNRLEAHVSQASTVAWQDANALLVRCQIQVAVTVTAVEPAIDVDRATTFQIVAPSGMKLIGDSDTLQVPGPGTFSKTLLLDVPLATSDPKKPAQTVPMELIVQPIRKPDHLSYDPPFVRVQQAGLPVPNQVKTMITPVVRKISQPVWTDLVESLAVFDADVLVRVDGSIPQRTMLTLVVPGNIRGNPIPPGTLLHPGETVMTLHVVARLTPGKSERLDFSIVAPPPTPAVRFIVERGFSLAVTVPPAPTIVCLDRSRIQPTIHMTVADNQDSAQVTIMPALACADPRAFHRLPKVLFRTSDPGTVLSPGAVPFFRPYTLRLRLLPPTSASFFLDSQQELDLDLHPAPATAAIQPGRVQMIVTRQAPFKRLLMYVAWAMFPLGIVALLTKAIRRFRETIVP